MRTAPDPLRTIRLALLYLLAASVLVLLSYPFGRSAP